MKKPIKILIDCHVFDEQYQGICSYIENLYNAIFKLNERDYQFYLVAHDIENLKIIFNQPEREHLFFIKYKFKNKLVRLGFELPKIIWEKKIDIAHFQYIVPPIKLCKYINTIHDLLFWEYPSYFSKKYRWSKYLLFKYSAFLSDHIFTVSEFSKRSIQHNFKISECNISVNPNIINPIYFETYSKQESVQYIDTKYGHRDYWLYVSRIEKRKNHDLLIDYFKKKNLNKKLLFIGRNEWKSDLWNQNVNKSNTNIHHIENISIQDLIHFYRVSNLFLYPSYFEGFGIPPLEAAASCIPTVCSDTSAMSDFDFLHKTTFNPFEIDQLDLAIKIALNQSTEELKEIKQSIEKKYTSMFIATEFLDNLKVNV